MGKSTTTQTARILAEGPSALEQLATDSQLTNFQNLSQLVSGGPGAADMRSATAAGRDLATMLEEFSRSGGLPTAADTVRARSFADDIFAGQRTRLNQLFEDQATETAQLSARLGRPVDDPVLRAKLAQGQARQMASLEGDITSAATQLALQQPMQRLGFAEKRAEVLGGLAGQAMKNRAALISLGAGIQNMQANQRLNFATREQTTVQEASLLDKIMAGTAVASNLFSIGAQAFTGMPSLGGGSSLDFSSSIPNVQSSGLSAPVKASGGFGGDSVSFLGDTTGDMGFFSGNPGQFTG